MSKNARLVFAKNLVGISIYCKWIYLDRRWNTPLIRRSSLNMVTIEPIIPIYFSRIAGLNTHGAAMDVGHSLMASQSFPQLFVCFVLFNCPSCFMLASIFSFSVLFFFCFFQNFWMSIFGCHFVGRYMEICTPSVWGLP